MSHKIIANCGTWRFTKNLSLRSDFFVISANALLSEVPSAKAGG
ncbi:MAG: hypothetical protein SFU27_11095 [Thermonemataceae bacterium]|nr:hypothetical protein [Thermonemataceae bacterium]